MKTLIKNGKNQKQSLCSCSNLIEDGIIRGIGTAFPETDFDEVIDAKEQLITPGLVDVHVHFREPGFEYKETIETGSMAARARVYDSLRNAKP